MSDRTVHMAHNTRDFDAIWQMIETVVDPLVRLPRLPFRASSGVVAVAQYERLLSADIIPVLQALAVAQNDGEVVTAAVEPAAAYYDEHYQFLPGFTVAPKTLDQGYWQGLTYSPSGDPTGEIGASADVLAVVGSSGQWAVWGERSWDLALVWAIEAGSWLHAGIPFVSPRTALEDFAGYGTWGTRLDEHAVATFVRNVAAFG